MAMATVDQEERDARLRAYRASRRRKLVLVGVVYLVLGLACIAFILPFVYIVLLSFKESKSIMTYPPQWIPNPPTLQNFSFLLQQNPFLRWMANTFLVAGAVTALKVLLDSMAGYAFAKMRFVGKRLMFLFILATLMVPFAATLVPAFIITEALGMVDTYQGLVIPALAAPIGIFMMRQFIISLPTDLENAARLDGCSEFGINWRIIMPLCKPALSVLAIFTFMAQWTNFLWPLATIRSNDMKVLTVGLASLRALMTTNWGIIAAGSLLTMIPITLVFLFLQKYFTAGVTWGAFKE